MRILLWHGYLLGGTGSNVYTRSLARAWSRDGHDVTVFSQEPRPEQFDIGAAAAIRPDIDGPLPVFVLDHYEGLDARLLQDFTEAERNHYVSCNVRALHEHLPADLVFTNHVLMGGPVGAATGACYAVKAHGSELEYSMRGRPELARLGRESLLGATATYVGSAHVGRVLTEICGPVDRVHEVPPGVDTDQWKPQPRAEALAALVAESQLDQPNPGNRRERLPDDGNAERLATFLADDEPTVVYFGKLSHNKGVHLLIRALAGIDARAVIVGFGETRADLEATASRRTLFTGPLEHRHLVHLLPLADVSVTPSIFPEAFGMVAAEAAASGTPPLVARHSGLAEVAARLAQAYPPRLAHLTSFEPGDVIDLEAKLNALLHLSPEKRRGLGLIARQVALERWSWSGIARRLLDPLPHGPIA
ncbi:MAG: glycosyltransferase family 4 protein [Actinomycetes bacterium]